MSRLKVISFKVDEDLLEQLEAVARQKNMSKSEIIRAAIRRYLYNENPRRPFVTKRIKIYG